MAAGNMKAHKLGWIGIGRMGYAMAERLAKAGCDISVWNRTRAKAEPLAKSGAKVVDALTDLAGCDIRFDIVLVAPRRWPVHLPDAWRLPGGTSE